MVGPPGRVEKIMALDLTEFHRSLKALAPNVALADAQAEVAIRVSGKTVRIAYEPLEEATLGGLLALPRARVTLFVEDLEESDRQAFLARFDRAFQRGGG